MIMMVMMSMMVMMIGVRRSVRKRSYNKKLNKFALM